MSLFYQAAEQNTQGVHALVNGDATTAIQAMSESIKGLKISLASSPASPEACDEESSGLKVSAVKIPLLENELFSQAMVFSSVEATHGKSELNACAASVIFNLSLAYHIRSLRTNNSALSHKAEKLYGMVIRLLDVSPCRSKQDILIRLGTINNLIQMRLQSNRSYEDIQKHAQSLTSCVHSLDFLQEPQIQDLLVHVLLVQRPVVAVAA